MVLPCSSDKENLSNMPQNNHIVVSDDEENQDAQGKQESESIEPLDFRRDWSQDMINTFENLRSSFQLEQVIR